MVGDAPRPDIDLLKRRIIVNKSRIGRRNIKVVSSRVFGCGVCRLEQKDDVPSIARDLSQLIADVDDTVAERKIDRIVFEIYTLAFFFDQREIGIIRPAVLVEIYPHFGAVYLGRIDSDIAAQLPRVQVLDSHLQMRVADKKELLAGNLVLKCRVLQLKLERRDRDAKDLGV